MDNDAAFSDPAAISDWFSRPDVSFGQKLRGLLMSQAARDTRFGMPGAVHGMPPGQSVADQIRSAQPMAARREIDASTLDALKSMYPQQDRGESSVMSSLSIPAAAQEEPAPRFSRAFTPTPAPSPRPSVAPSGGGFGRPISDRLGMYSNTSLRPDPVAQPSSGVRQAGASTVSPTPSPSPQSVPYPRQPYGGTTEFDALMSFVARNQAMLEARKRAQAEAIRQAQAFPPYMFSIDPSEVARREAARRRGYQIPSGG